MTTTTIVFLLFLSTFGAGRELRNDYNHYEYSNEDWDHYEYNYQWADHDEAAERGEAFWREVCREWNSEEVYLEGDKESFACNILTSYHVILDP